MENLTNEIRMAFYEGSDGPRIMLFGPAHMDLHGLQSLFRKLAGGEGPFELHSLPFIKPFGGVKITAICSGSIFEERGKAQGITKIRSAGANQYEWRRTAEGWDYLAELIDPLVKEGAQGHQYLTRYPGEDAIVVVSRGEYSDDVLKTC